MANAPPNDAEPTPNLSNAFCQSDSSNKPRPIKRQKERQRLTSAKDIEALLVDCQPANGRKVFSAAPKKKKMISQIQRRTTDIFVTNKSNFKHQMNKCREMLDTNCAPGFSLWIHGVGVCHSTALNLALQLSLTYPDLILSPHTDSVQSLDQDVCMSNDGITTNESLRSQSAIHIKVTCPPLAS